MQPFSVDPETSCETAQRRLAARFAAAGSRAPMLEARLILCEALGVDHAGLLREAKKTVGDAAERIAALAKRRTDHEPVSRILGHREFWGLNLEIDASVLDPRADTETVVEAVIEALASRRTEALRILDLGTGSGAILCALLASFPHAFGVGIDISETACRIAKRNLTRSGLDSRGAIFCGNWATALCDGAEFDVIVSNPPYIRCADIAGLDPEVRDHDPQTALDGGVDGYDAYRAIAPILPQLLARAGVVVFEVGIGQAASVAGLLEAVGLCDASTKRDLAGIERAVVAKREAREDDLASSGKCDETCR